MPILLLGIGVALIILNVKSIKNEKNKNLNFSEVLKEKENNISDVEVKVIELRREIAETILELQKDIEDIKELVKVDEYKTIKPTQVNVENTKDDITMNEIKGDKSRQVMELLHNGLSDDDVCKELNIGKGELLLIRKLLEN
ncbi:DUF6115 domain-containing protein [Clostridium frigidicarnis]|uniref:DUF2802 domain-containing protein n=1 Tax=Clostridium frigidicarnis TaxID=84698 RepID=A0A1I0VFB9_9CLOT|nr:hypothetical protein [Clostridium frigidicarnis]SFA75021.1 hypothetical protein SAMN04488528_100236 [Clostridium frigidicarnis]